MGLMESPSSWKIVKLVLLAETGRCPEERDQKLQSNSADIGDVEVVCILYCSELGKVKKSLKSGRVCMLVEWMGQAASTYKCWLLTNYENTGNGREKGIPCSDMVQW